MEEKGDAQDRAITNLVIQTCMKEKLPMDRIKITRFGKRDEVKPRPLRVTLENESQKHAMLRGSRNLKDEESLKHLGLAMNRTRIQLEEYKKERERKKIQETLSKNLGSQTLSLNLMGNTQADAPAVVPLTQEAKL